MEPQQVFTSYEGGPARERAGFCLACGSPLHDHASGGRVRRACGACGFVRYRAPAPGVSVLVVDGERFLLCRRHERELAGGRWCLPCGYVEFDEDFLAAAAREVEEETGIVVEIRSILSVVSNFITPNVHTVVTVLLAHPVAGEARAGDDIELVRWFSAEDELPEMAFEADPHIIRRYFATRLPGAPVQKRSPD